MSTRHTCDAFVATCIDFRIQKTIDTWIQENIGEGNFDRVAIAGGVLDLDAVLAQIELSDRLHSIKRVVLMNHEDCGGYGAEGSDERHRADLLAAKETVSARFPHLEITPYYVHLDGNVVAIN